MSASARQNEIQRIQEVYSRRGSEELRYGSLNPGQLLLAQERERDFLRLLGSHFETLRDRKVLEIGCNSGLGLLDWIRWGATPRLLRGVDILEDRLNDARTRLPSSVNIALESADQLSDPADFYDIVVQSTVFSSILDLELQARVASEMLRVTKPGGLIVSYDFFINNPWNKNVRAVSRARLRRLFEGHSITFRRSTTLSPMVRATGRYSSKAAVFLSLIPFLKTHWLAVITKRPTS